MRPCNTDVPYALLDYDVNRCDADVPFLGRLSRLHRSVCGSLRDPFHRISPLTQCGQFLSSPTDSDLAPKKGRVFPNCKSTFPAPTPPNPVEVAARTAREEYPSSMTDENVLYIGAMDHLDGCSDDDAEKGV
jgi:hypothetical protein